MQGGSNPQASPAACCASCAANAECNTSEIPNIAIARKSIVAARPVAAGEIFSEDNLAAKRPGTGLSPMLWDQVVGRPAPRNFEADELIEVE